MEKNQNDKNNQPAGTPSEQSGTKSYQQQTQEGKKKTETDPNNPTANINKPQGTQQDNLQRQGTSNQGKSSTIEKNTEENKEEIMEEIPAGKTGSFSEQNENRAGNQNNKKGNR